MVGHMDQSLHIMKAFVNKGREGGDLPDHCTVDMYMGFKHNSMLKCVFCHILNKIKAIKARDPPQCTYLGAQIVQVDSRDFHPHPTLAYPKVTTTLLRPQITFTTKTAQECELDDCHYWNALHSALKQEVQTITKTSNIEFQLANLGYSPENSLHYRYKELKTIQRLQLEMRHSDSSCVESDRFATTAECRSDMCR